MRTVHVASLFPQDPVLAGELVNGYRDGEPVPIACQITPSDATTIFDDFAVETKNPWLLMANPGPQDLFVPGAEVEWNGKRYGVAAPARAFLGFGNADHFSAPLEAID